MFSKNGSTVRSAFALPLLRVPPQGIVKLVVQSESIVFFNVHWLSKSWVCPGDGCLCCGESVPRLRGFLIGTVEVHGSKKAVLVEATPASLERLRDQLRLENRVLVPGVEVICRRNAPNRPILFDYQGEGRQTARELTSDHRLLAACAVLFALPLPDRSDDLDSYARKAAPVARTLLAGALARA